MATAEEDRFSAEMWSLGSLGTQTVEEAADRTLVVAYFAYPISPTLDQLVGGQRQIPGAALVETGEEVSADWQSAYRSRSRPFPVGRNWIVDPREPGSEAVETPARRRLLRIPARTAFGTGSHESTRLIVDLLEELPLTGRRVLDVGTGTGILALMALVRGAGFVAAIDLDSAAVCLARQNAVLNGQRLHLIAASPGAIRIDSTLAGFDIVLANVLPDGIRGDLPHLAECLGSGGQVLLSGLLAEQEASLIPHLVRSGLRCRHRRTTGGWVALHLERALP